MIPFKTLFQIGLLLTLGLTQAYADKKCVAHWHESQAQYSCDLIEAKKITGFCHIKASCKTKSGDFRIARKNTTAALVESLVNCDGKLSHYWC